MGTLDIRVFRSIHNNLISYAFQVEERGIFVYFVKSNNWAWYSDVALVERQVSVLGEYKASSLLDVLLVTGMDEQDIIDNINENIREWAQILNSSPDLEERN
jgi:hypothetical protein